MWKNGLVIVLLLLTIVGCSKQYPRQQPPEMLGHWVYSENKIEKPYIYAIVHSRMDCYRIGDNGVVPVAVDDFTPELAGGSCGEDYDIDVRFCSKCFTKELYQEFLERGYVASVKDTIN